MGETGLRTKSRGSGAEAYASPDTFSHAGLDGGFFNTFRDCVLGTLGEVLGKPALGALVSHYHLDGLAKSPEAVHEILESIFHNGAVVLEKLIVKELYRELNVAQDEAAAFEFETLVLSAREGLKNRGAG